MSGTPARPTDGARRVRIGADLLRGNLLQLIAALVLALASTAATLAVPLIVKDIIGAFARHGGLLEPVALMAGLALGEPPPRPRRATSSPGSGNCSSCACAPR